MQLYLLLHYEVLWLGVVRVSVFKVDVLSAKDAFEDAVREWVEAGIARDPDKDLARIGLNTPHERFVSQVIGNLAHLMLELVSTVIIVNHQ